MYKKIVVPLDGSNLAEQALLYLDEVAAHSPEVMLVSVTEKLTAKVPRDEVMEHYVSGHEQQQPMPKFVIYQPTVLYPDFDTAPPMEPETLKVTVGKMADTAEAYLEKIASRLADKGFEVTTNILLGDPAKEIVHFAEKQGADLILMASTGGKPGLSRWNIEHIAERVVETTEIPVTIVKPAPGFKETRPKRHGRPSSIIGGP
jgi:nucleotide-binding universal stress UspA family protein